MSISSNAYKFIKVSQEVKSQENEGKIQYMIDLIYLVHYLDRSQHLVHRVNSKFQNEESSTSRRQYNLNLNFRTCMYVFPVQAVFDGTKSYINNYILVNLYNIIIYNRSTITIFMIFCYIKLIHYLFAHYCRFYIVKAW